MPCVGWLKVCSRGSGSKGSPADPQKMGPFRPSSASIYFGCSSVGGWFWYHSKNGVVSHVYQEPGSALGSARREVLHGDSQLHYSGPSQGLVDGVAGSQGCLFTRTNSSVPLAVPSVYSQECGGALFIIGMSCPLA